MKNIQRIFTSATDETASPA